MIFANFASLLPTDTSALETSISALESSISILERSIAPLVRELPFWEYFGFASAGVVVIGVLLELQDILHRHDEDKTAWALSFFGVSRSLEKPRFKPPQVSAATALLQLERSVFPLQKIVAGVELKTANEEGIVLITVGKHP